MNLMLNALVIVATILGSGMALPQARRLARTRRADGVSTIWVGVSLSLNAWWIAYAVSAPVWALLPVSTISFALYSFMAYVFVTSIGPSSLRGLLVGVFGLGMVPLPFLVVGGWELAGVVVGLCYGLQLLPAVVAVMRTRALAGVSAATWLIAWIESFIWLVYGYVRSDTALLAAGVLGVAMTSGILIRLGVTGHQPLALFARIATSPRWRKAQPSLS